MPSLVRAVIDRQAGRVSLSFPYDLEVISIVKSVPGSRWNKDQKKWTVSLHAWEVLSKKLRSQILAEIQTVDVPLPYSMAARLRPYQIEAASFMTRQLRSFLTMEMRTGKAQPLDAKVLTPTGWVTMGSLKVGDCVIDPDGGTALVGGVYPQGTRPVYRVTTTDGESTECCAEHLWTIQTPKLRSGGKYDTRSLQELMSMPLKTSGERPSCRYFLPVTQPVHFNSLGRLPLDSYVLGALIGNGHLAEYGVSLSSGDDGVLDTVRSRLPPSVHLVSKSGVYDWRISRVKETGTNEVISILRSLELIGCNAQEKFIPKMYLRGSVGDRKELLAGLMDTDGDSPDSREISTLVYNTTSARLKDDVVELVRSLGGYTTTTLKTNCTYTYRDEVCTGSDCWRVYIRLPFNPYKTPRKSDKWQRPSYMARGIESIEYVGEKETQCIRVSSTRHLYVTDGYIVTHNTPCAITALCGLFQAGMIQRALVTYPAGVVGEWERQFKEWSGIPLYKLQSRTLLHQSEIDRLRGLDYLVVGCSYELIGDREEDVLKIFGTNDDTFPEAFGWIGDEIHQVKNRKSKRFKVLEQLTKLRGSLFRSGLSGTIMRNRSRDLWGVFELIDPGSVGSYWTYAKRYCDAQRVEYGWTDLGISNEGELKTRLAMMSYRKTRAEVAAWLPKSDRSVIVCAVAEPLLKKYRKLERHYAVEIKGALDDDFGSRDVLRQLAAATSEAKIPTAADRAIEHTNRGVKVLVFGHFHESVKGLQAEFEKRAADAKDSTCGDVPPVFCAGGWNTPERRREITDQWRSHTGPTILLANTIASGVGIDLSDADVAIFLEQEWVPADFRQAEDRIQDVHLGKRTTPPIYEYLIVKDTIDEAMASAMLKKIRSIEAIVGADVETAGVASTLRGSGVIGEGRLGLEATDAVTVHAAIASIRDRWIKGDSSSDDSGSNDALAAAFSDDWEDDTSSSDDSELDSAEI